MHRIRIAVDHFRNGIEIDLFLRTPKFKSEQSKLLITICYTIIHENSVINYIDRENRNETNKLRITYRAANTFTKIYSVRLPILSVINKWVWNLTFVFLCCSLKSETALKRVIFGRNAFDSFTFST